MLAQNRPNPFLGQTVIDYFIPGDVQQKAFIQITSADGKIIGCVRIKESGRRSIDFCDMTILYLNDDMLQY